jgi:hypothetical protein
MSDTEDFDVDAEYEKLLAGLKNDEKANLNWLKMTTKEDHDEEVKRLTELQEKDAKKLHELNKQASEMLAKHKADEKSKSNQKPITDDEFDKLLNEFGLDLDGGRKTRRHKKHTYKKKKSMYKKKHTYKKKHVSKKKHATRRRKY